MLMLQLMQCFSIWKLEVLNVYSLSGPIYSRSGERAGIYQDHIEGNGLDFRSIQENLAQIWCHVARAFYFKYFFMFLKI